MYLIKKEQKTNKRNIFVRMDMNDLEAVALIKVVMQCSNPMTNSFNPLPVYAVMINF